MELPECHAAAVEKAVDAMIDAQEFPGAHIKAGEVQRNSARHEARAAIAAYLSALKEQQMALDVTALWKSSGDVLATNGLENIAGLVPALIIRMESEQ